MQTTLPQPLKKVRSNTASENRADSPLRPRAPVPKPPPSQISPNYIAMIIITRPDATEEQIDHIVSRIRNWGLKSEVSRGEHRVVIGVIGPEDKIREKPLGAFPGVESVTPVLKPYKLVAYE